MSLNVCGLFNKLKYGILEETIKDCDFVCLCEIKTNFIPQDEFENFQVFIREKSNKNDKPSGLAILANKKNEKYYKIVNTVSKWVTWLLVGNNSTNLDFVLGAVYIPCEKSILTSENIFEEISNDIVNIKAKYEIPFILMGDFNARTSILNDYLFFEDELIRNTGTEEEMTQNLEKLNLCQKIQLR